MRTTVDLDPHLLETAKRLASRERRTLSALLGDALAAYVSGRRQSSKDPPFELLVRGKPHARFPSAADVFALETDEDIASLALLENDPVLLPDVNVPVHAHRMESPEHGRYSEWLRDLALGPAPFALSELGASGFVRIVTNPKIWEEPTTTEDALEFTERLRGRSNARLLTHGPASWDVFARLCREARARGKLVADAYHAALAIEHGCELVTADGDFARFIGLRHRHPLT